MKELTKVLAVLINAANYGVGIAVCAILMFKWDFISVFYIMGMTTNESLFFNLIMFQLGLVLLGILLVFMTNDQMKKDTVIEFPVFYEIIPIILAVISIVYSFSAETAREKLVMIGCSVLYALFSAVIVYCGSRVFQVYEDKDKKSK